MLPPLRTRKYSPTTATNTTNTTSTISPRSKKHSFVYNQGGYQSFSRSPRFESDRQEHPDSFLYNKASDFDSKNKKGASIGYGERYQFTKAVESNPGAGRYYIPVSYTHLTLPTICSV